MALLVEFEGKPFRVVGTYALENGSRDLGDVELRETATVSGRFRCSSPWDPSGYTLVLREPRREFPLGPDGSFHVEHVEPGATYFALRTSGTEDGQTEHEIGFEGLPDFHVHLAPGEERSLSVDLDPYVRATLDLTVTIGGEVPDESARFLVSPIGQVDREFSVRADVEGARMKASCRSLGPCRISISQRGASGGWVRLELPGPEFDLRPGSTLQRELDVPAGWIAIELPPGHAANTIEQLSLDLDGLDGRAEVIGAKHVAGSEEGARSLRVGPVPPGNYRATLVPAPWRKSPQDPEVLATFEVVIRPGEVETVQL